MKVNKEYINSVYKKANPRDKSRIEQACFDALLVKWDTLSTEFKEQTMNLAKGLGFEDYMNKKLNTKIVKHG